ncbi:hypothetical protein G5V58_21265 [Nocardioides anomalus]|uniref:Alpha/beta hydrolase n=1 Tax=Nocardioides anomalus TaxID=2712223 RepID=A0A6G6WIB4_9ACTN|nr:hypothetical protein [Nocardioides anomalus]QIG44962.1 hypothetical protein G5V58_21265 [Nocardioides anomalus]
MSDEIIQVTGGAAGLAASYADARALAAAFDAAGDDLRAVAATALGVARDGDLLTSAALSPTTCAVAEAAVLATATSVSSAALSWEGTAAAVRLAVGGLEATDGAVRTALDRQLGPYALPPLLPLVAVDPDVLSDHPGLTSHAIAALGGPLGAVVAGLLYGEPGGPVVTPYAATLPRGRPRSVRDLLAHLRAVAELSGRPDSPANGTIEVQTLDGPDGRRHVVYLPGTDDFNAPWEQGADVRDLETDLDLAGGRPDAYRAGILEALHRAGARPDEPVLLVGHSAGGMAAAALVASSGGFAVTHAVTAGAPTAQVPGFPAGTHVLSLEQVGDIVPELDGAPNPDSVEQTTVLFDAHPEQGVLAHHGYDAYEAGAALADASADPSVHESVASIDGFLAGDGPTSSQVFQITRAPGVGASTW